MPDLKLPDLLEIETARKRIGAHAHWTPLLSSRSIGELSNADVWLKCENLQKAGAFKFRGAEHWGSWVHRWLAPFWALAPRGV